MYLRCVRARAYVATRVNIILLLCLAIVHPICAGIGAAWHQHTRRDIMFRRLRMHIHVHDFACDPILMQKYWSILLALLNRNVCAYIYVAAGSVQVIVVHDQLAIRFVGTSTH